MPDLDQIKQGEQGARDRRGRLPKRRSGPAARSPRLRQPCWRRGRGSGMRFAADPLQMQQTVIAGAIDG